MMTCNSARELLPLYVGADLTDERMAQVREHVAQCADCAREMERFENCRELVSELTAPKLSRAVVNDMWTAIRQEIGVAPEPKVLRFSSGLWLKMAAVMLIGVSVGYSVYGVASLFARPGDTRETTVRTEDPADLTSDQVRNANGNRTPNPVVITTKNDQQQHLLNRKMEEDLQSMRRQVIELQAENEALKKRITELNQK